MFMKKLLAALLALAVWALPLTALAESGVLTLPSGLKAIEDGAFQGDTSIDRVVAPEGLEKIGSNAFAGSSLNAINLPGSLSEIDDTAFDGPEHVTVTAEKGSWAYEWAVDKGYIAPVVAPPYPESPHPYTNNMNQSWTYTWPEAVPALMLTFDPQTDFEEYCDGLSITGGDGFERQYDTPYGLSDGAVVVPGSGFTLNFHSDGDETRWGFAFTEIRAMTQAEYDAWLEEQRANAYTYTVLEDDTVKVTGYNGPDASIVVPATFEGKPVSTIGEAFLNSDSPVTDLVLPEGVVEIEWFACSGSNLRTVTLPDTLESIGIGAFEECADLTTVNLPAGLIVMGTGMNAEREDSVFTSCDRLTNVTAEKGTFAYAYAVYFGYIKDSAMAYPESDHPYETDTVRTWHYAWAAKAPGLKITFSADTRLAQGDWLTLRDALGRQVDYTGDELAGQTVMAAGGAFSLTLEAWSGNIDYGFKVTSVTAMTQYEYNVWANQLNADPFEYTTGDDGNLKVTGYRGVNPVATVSASHNGVPVTTIGARAFADVIWVTQVVLPTGIKVIEEEAFADAVRLDKINFPNGLTTIGSAAFMGCERLGASQDLSFPASLNSIGAWDGIGTENTMGEIFQGCTQLGQVTAPKGSYAYNWTIIFGHYCPEEGPEGLEVVPMLSIGRLGDKDGAEVWDNLPGLGDWNIQFRVSAPDVWTASWPDAGVFYDDDVNGQPQYPDVTSLTMTTMDNDTGAARETTVTFTCGDETVTYILRQLPKLDAPTLTGPEELVSFKEYYDDWDSFGRVDEEPYWPVLESVDLVWSPVTGAASYRLTLNGANVRTVAATSGQTTVTTALTADDLAAYRNDHVECALVAVDENGYPYPSENYLFRVMDPDRPPFDYTTLADGTLKLTRYFGTAAEAVVPAEIDGVPVTVIGEQTFNCNDVITSVTVPAGVTQIEEFAFAYSTYLTSVSLPDTLTEIGIYAFEDCTALTTVNLPSSLTRIGMNVGVGGENHILDIFSECENLVTVTAEAGTYAYDWAVYFGYIQPQAQHLTVKPIATIGELTVENGVNVWKNLPGAREWYISFVVNAPGEWRADWDHHYDDDEIPSFSSDDLVNPMPAARHGISFFTSDNDTGVERELEITFSCGDESVVYVLRQLPMPGNFPTLVAPQAMVDYSTAYAAWVENGYEGDPPEPTEMLEWGDVETVWTSTGAEGYEVRVSGSSRGLTHPATSEPTFTITVPAEWVEPSPYGDLSYLQICITDEYGYTYLDSTDYVVPMQ